MLKRTLVFTRQCSLGLKNGQLHYRPREEDARIVPLEDIGFVLLEHPAISITSRLIDKLVENGTVIVFCNQAHHPASMLLSLDGHSTHTEVIRAQIQADKPLYKRLWQQIVRAKIVNQAAVLEALNRKGSEALRKLARTVKSGDADNREAMAARIYWKHLFSMEDFSRSREGPPPNHLLNYGYAILRAACARALVSSGLHCAIGIHHRNRYGSSAKSVGEIAYYSPRAKGFCSRLDHGDASIDDMGSALVACGHGDAFMKGKQ